MTFFGKFHLPRISSSLFREAFVLPDFARLVRYLLVFLLRHLEAFLVPSHECPLTLNGLGLRDTDAPIDRLSKRDRIKRRK